jgi:hypothetical protein
MTTDLTEFTVPPTQGAISGTLISNYDADTRITTYNVEFIIDTSVLGSYNVKIYAHGTQFSSIYDFSS